MKQCCLKICPCCAGRNWHMVFSIVGLSISFTELILASVYNFHICGFALSIIGIFSSGLYLYLNIREKKQAAEENDQENFMD